MCLFHDVEESRAGDQNRVHKRYVKVDHEEIMHDQLDGLFQDNEILDIMKEYEARESFESKLAKDADRLDQFLLLKEHAQNGNKEALRRFGSNHNGKRERLLTEQGKQFFDTILETEPNEWRENIWTETRK